VDFGQHAGKIYARRKVSHLVDAELLKKVRLVFNPGFRQESKLPVQEADSGEEKAAKMDEPPENLVFPAGVKQGRLSRGAGGSKGDQAVTPCSPGEKILHVFLVFVLVQDGYLGDVVEGPEVNGCQAVFGEPLAIEGDVLVTMPDQTPKLDHLAFLRLPGRDKRSSHEIPPEVRIL